MSDEETAGMSGELVEKVAHAFAKSRVMRRRAEKIDRSEMHPGDAGLGLDDEINVQLSLIYREDISAAIAVVLEWLGEPSEGMLEAGVEVTFEDDARLAEMWRAMLSKAKEEAGL